MTSEGRTKWFRLIGAFLGTPLVVGVVTLLVTAYYQRTLLEPELSGSILFTAMGSISDRAVVPAPQRAITTYVVLENLRETAVTPIDYLLEVRIGGVWQAGAYHPNYLRSKEEGVALEFQAGVFDTDKGAGRVSLHFPTDKSLLVASLQVPILKTQPRSGLLTFLLPLNVGAIEDMRIKVVDAGQRTYIVRQAPAGRMDPRVILRLDPSVIVHRN